MTTGLGWVFELAIRVRVGVDGGTRVFVRGTWVLEQPLRRLFFASSLSFVSSSPFTLLPAKKSSDLDKP